MSPWILVSVLAVAVLVVAVVAGRLLARPRNAHASDLGAVSARWIAELRRDEPWSRS